jgi:hypothetical protein
MHKAISRLRKSQMVRGLYYASECDGSVLITEVTLSNRGTTPVLLTDKHLVGR